MTKKVGSQREVTELIKGCISSDVCIIDGGCNHTDSCNPDTCVIDGCGSEDDVYYTCGRYDT